MVRSVGGIAQASRYQFANGMIALVHRNPSTPTVSVRGELRLGAVDEPATANGLALLTGAALIRGAGERTFQQLVAETEARGCGVSAAGGLHTTSFGGRALVEDLPLILEFLADMLIRPTFPLHEVTKLRNQFLMSLREQEEEPMTRASRTIHTLLYPSEHPYSRLSTGTFMTVQALERDDLVRFHGAYHPQDAIIAVVGDVEPDAVFAALERHFGSWNPVRPPRTTALPAVPLLQEPQRCDIVMEGKLQSDVIWAVHGLARNDPDFYPAMLANLILGRLGLGGRLGEEVRENQGMAYYCSSSLDADLGAGPWSAVAGVNPNDVERAIEAMLHEIRLFAHEGPTAQELADARDFLTGMLVLGLETNDGMAGTLLAIERYQLGLDFIERYPALLAAVSHEQILDVARRYLGGVGYALAVAGPPVN